MTFPSATDYNQLSCSQTWWWTQPFLSCQCNVIIIAGQSDTPGHSWDASTAPNLWHTPSRELWKLLLCKRVQVRLWDPVNLADLICHSPSIRSQLISCPAKGMLPRSRQCMRNVNAINTEIIIIKFWALYTVRECKNKTISAKGLCFKTWILESNTVKWKVTSLRVSKAIPRQLENPGLLFRNPNI